MTFKFISGLANCHLPGLFSLVVSERVSPEVGMRRVFFAGSDCRMELWDGADFRIKPHNHRQNIKLTLLFGDVQNVSLKFNQWGEFHVWKYEFGSALLGGKFELKRREEMQCGVREETLTTEVLPMHWSDVHTVVARPNSAWMVEEGELAPVGMERCFSVSHRLELSSKGLYTPMDASQVDSIERVINARCAT